MIKKLFAATLFAAALAPVAAHAAITGLNHVPDVDRSQVTIHSWTMTGFKFVGGIDPLAINCTWDLVAVDNKTRRFITIAREVNTGSLMNGMCQKPQSL